MPSPWLMARKSGLYCRVFVPADLRPTIGQRFLVRSLGERVRDQASLISDPLTQRPDKEALPDSRAQVGRDKDPAIKPAFAGHEPRGRHRDTSRDTPCLLYTSPSPRDRQKSRMPSSA